MSLFHRHHWREARRYFVPPRLTGPVDTVGFESYELDTLINGYTVVELRCSDSDCGDISSRVLPGNATPPPMPGRLPSEPPEPVRPSPMQGQASGEPAPAPRRGRLPSEPPFDMYGRHSGRLPSEP